MDTTTRGQLRISDADRDLAIAELSEHFQAGRLTMDELQERTGQALQARTGQDLVRLFTDLPRNRPPATDPAPPQAAPAPWTAGPVRFDQRRPVPSRHAPARILVAACAVVLVASIVGGLSSSGVGVSLGGGHHALFALVPVLVVLFVVRRLFGRV